MSEDERGFWLHHAERILALGYLNTLNLLVAKGSDEGYHSIRAELRKKIYLPYELEIMEAAAKEKKEEEYEKNWEAFKSMFGGGKIK